MSDHSITPYIYNNVKECAGILWIHVVPRYRSKRCIDGCTLVGIKKEIKFLPLQTRYIVLLVTLDMKRYSTGEKASLAMDGICAACCGCPPGISSLAGM